MAQCLLLPLQVLLVLLKTDSASHSQQRRQELLLLLLIQSLAERAEFGSWQMLQGLLTQGVLAFYQQHLI